MEYPNTLFDYLPKELLYEIDKIQYSYENVKLIGEQICIYYENPEIDGLFIDCSDKFYQYSMDDDYDTTAYCSLRNGIKIKTSYLTLSDDVVWRKYLSIKIRDEIVKIIKSNFLVEAPKMVGPKGSIGPTMTNKYPLPTFDITTFRKFGTYERKLESIKYEEGLSFYRNGYHDELKFYASLFAKSEKYKKNNCSEIKSVEYLPHSCNRESNNYTIELGNFSLNHGNGRFYITSSGMRKNIHPCLNKYMKERLVEYLY